MRRQSIGEKSHSAAHRAPSSQQFLKLYRMTVCRHRRDVVTLDAGEPKRANIERDARENDAIVLLRGCDVTKPVVRPGVKHRPVERGCVALGAEEEWE